MSDMVKRTDTEELSKAVGQILDELSLIEITNDADLKQAAEFREAAKSTLKAVTKTFAPEREFYYDTWKAVKETENQFAHPLEEAISIASKKMSDYVTAREERARAAAILATNTLRSKIQDAVINRAIETGDDSELDVDLAPVVVKPQESIKIEGTSFILDWDIELVDFAKVPDKFKMVDMSSAKKYVKATKGKEEIPGFRIIEKRQIRQSV